MRKNLLVALLGLCMLMTAITGCGKTVSLDSTSVYVYQDGRVYAAIYEEFDSSVYSKEDLQTYLEEAITAYNQNTCGISAAYEKDTKEALSIAIESFDVSNNEAVLKTIYATAEDYLAFNAGDESLLQLMTGTVGSCKPEQYDLTYVTPSGEAYTDELAEDTFVVLAEGDKTIQVEGTIVCVSKGVTVDGEKASIPASGGLCAICFTK